MAEFPFDLGAYLITVTISDNQNKVIATSTKVFYSQTKGLPAVITDIDKAIAQTVYIATPDELHYMEDGKDVAEKTKRFLEFWKKKILHPIMMKTKCLMSTLDGYNMRMKIFLIILKVGDRIAGWFYNSWRSQ